MQIPACSILFARSHGFLGKAIRFFTRSIKEPKSIATHAGLIVVEGDENTAISVDAEVKTVRHTLKDGYGSGSTEVCIFESIGLTEEEKARIIAKVETYVGRDYGYFKLLLHAADWCLNGAYFFRRLGRIDKYPICSYEVAHAFSIEHKDFGVAPDQATPDDIWDYVTSHPDKYRFVWQHGTMYQEPK